MPRFVTERDMPGVRQMGGKELRGASQTSCSNLRNLWPEIQSVHSYVTDDKVYCIYRAPDAHMIRQHAEQGGFRANRISEVRATIDPATVE